MVYNYNIHRRRNYISNWEMHFTVHTEREIAIETLFNSTHKPRNGGCDMHVTIYTKPEMVIGTHVLMLRRVQEMVIWSDVYCYAQQRKW